MISIGAEDFVLLEARAKALINEGYGKVCTVGDRWDELCSIWEYNIRSFAEFSNDDGAGS